ncbi:DUF4173 domain-containing protein [Auraticoccus sp. F435]|uniref:DUF4173 domain-containing protein n=1 Tax=Auraticoccus cholistanensis TaxID=2656650 RepID=A0A6A9URH3_9ACTN|nr:DUF4173 domain-containing protein [Auraticoccus cholistanensis]
MGSPVDALFGSFWPDPRPGQQHRGLALAALLPAVVAATTAPGAGVGVAATVVAGLVLALVVVAHRPRARRGDLSTAALAGLMVLTGVLTSSSWAVLLCWAAAIALVPLTSTRARSTGAALAAVAALAIAWVRGLPWLARSLGAGRQDPATLGRTVRTAVVAAGLVAVFTGLLASADDVFASWVLGLVPDLDRLPLRLLVLGAVLLLTWSLLTVVVLPPDVGVLRARPRPPLRRSEWGVPVGSVVVVLAVFLAAQASALFGGEAYLRAHGTSHAEHVHQGFGQLVAATCLVLVVVATTVRRAARATPADRRWLRGLLCTLCLLALAVAASALHRMALYEAAFGASRLRLLVATFEVWVAVVLLLAATVCVRLRGSWVPRIAVWLGCVMLLALTAAGPDRVVAERNVARHAATGTLDARYLGTLTAEAVPALDRLPEPLRSCTLRRLDLAPDPAGWDLPTGRALELLRHRPVDRGLDCRLSGR